MMKALVAVLLSTSLVTLALAGGGSNEHHSQCQKADEVVAPDASNAPSSCPIVQALQNCSASVSVSVQAELNVLINTVTGIVGNSSLNATQQVSACALQISLFFSLHVDVEVAAAFCPINTASGAYGVIRDVIQVGVQLDVLGVDAQVALDGSGNCPLFTALASACSSCSASDSAAVNALIANLTVIIQTPGYTQDQTLAFIGIEITAFLAANPSLSFLINVELSGYGIVGNFLGACNEFAQTATLAAQINGTTTADCPLLAALQSASTNASLPANAQTACQQIIVSLEGNFATTTDFAARLNFVSSTIFGAIGGDSQLASILLSIEISVSFGDIYDLLACSHFCTENNVCQLVNDQLEPIASTTAASTTAASTSAPSTDGNSTTAASTSAPSTDGNSTTAASTSAPSTDGNSTTAESTTAASTTAASSSAPSSSAPSSSAPSTAESTSAPATSASTPAPVSTTPLPPANCSKAAVLPLISKKHGHWLIIDCIKAGIAEWNATLVFEFASTFKKIKKCVKSPPKGGYKKKMKKLPKLITKWNQNDKPTRQLLLNIKLTDGVTVWGTIGQLCTCGPKPVKLSSSEQRG